MDRECSCFRTVISYVIILIMVMGFMQHNISVKAADMKSADEILGLSVGVGKNFAAYITNSNGKVLTGDKDKKVYSAKKSSVFDPYQVWHIYRIGDNCFTIKNLGTGKYLDVSKSSTEKGATVCMWEQKEEVNSNQRWRFYDAGNSSYNIKADCTDCVLDVNATTGDATMQTFINRKQATQNFTLDTISAAGFQPKNVKVSVINNKATVTWSAASSGIVDSYNVELYNVNNEAKPVQTKTGLLKSSRTHTFSILEGGTYYVRVYGVRKDYQYILSSYTKSDNFVGGESVSNALGSPKNIGKNIYAYITNSTGHVFTGDTNKKVYTAKKNSTFDPYQIWNIKNLTSNCYTIMNLGTEKNLDVSGSGTESGTPVIMWAKKDSITSNQKWRFYDAGNSNFVIGSDCTKCVLDTGITNGDISMQAFVSKTYSTQNFKLDIIDLNDFQPQSLEITAGNNKITVSWKAPLSNLADGYNIELYSVSDTKKTIQKYTGLASDTRSFVFENVAEGSYYVQVYGINTRYQDIFSSSIKSKSIAVRESVKAAAGDPVSVGTDFCTYISSPDGKVLTGDTDNKVYSSKKNKGYDPYQIWNIKRISTDCYVVMNLGTGKYLNVNGSGTVSDILVCMQAKDNVFSSNQKWYFYDAGNNNYIIGSDCTECVLNMDSSKDNMTMQSFISKTYAKQLFKLNNINKKDLQPNDVKVKTGKKSITVTWTAAKSDMVSKYTIEVYSTKDKKKAVLTKTKSAGKKLKITFKNLKKGKYYIRITGEVKSNSDLLSASVKSKKFTIKK